MRISLRKLSLYIYMKDFERTPKCITWCFKRESTKIKCCLSLNLTTQTKWSVAYKCIHMATLKCNKGTTSLLVPNRHIMHQVIQDDPELQHISVLQTNHNLLIADVTLHPWNTFTIAYWYKSWRTNDILTSAVSRISDLKTSCLKYIYGKMSVLNKR